jgi:methylated-DNA-[protein]-cysteine S-methyltransferase
MGKKFIYFYKNKILGTFGVASMGRKITDIVFGGDNKLKIEVLETPAIAVAADEILAYLDGKIRYFSTPIEIGGTFFQRKVWSALLNIPFGEIRTYKQIAEAVGCPKGCRAVGMANNRNRLPILIPCHRVINSGDKLGGYGGGVEIKRKLLEIEGIKILNGNRANSKMI